MNTNRHYLKIKKSKQKHRQKLALQASFIAVITIIAIIQLLGYIDGAQDYTDYQKMQLMGRY
jgi:hypothetical protein